MHKKILIQNANSHIDDCLHSLLKEKIHHEKFDVARIASAYATVSGVLSLLDIFNKHGLKKSYWVIGLDDAISHPGVFDTLNKIENVEVRVASFEKSNARFHPKFMSFECDANPTAQWSLIGSANLTNNALMKNAEATSIIELEIEDDKTEITEAWSMLWDMGHSPSDEELDAYKLRYAKSKFYREKLRKLTTKSPNTNKKKDILKNDNAEIDPSLADTCWIECGKITGGGTQLEIKAEQARFFGLSSFKREHKAVQFKVSDGEIVDLNFDFRGNDMWRLQFKKTVPEVARGLRQKAKDGSLKRSTLVAVFERASVNNRFELKFIKIHGKQFAKLRDKTEASGTLGKTSARQYGWC